MGFRAAGVSILARETQSKSFLSCGSSPKVEWLFFLLAPWFELGGRKRRAKIIRCPASRSFCDDLYGMALWGRFRCAEQWDGPGTSASFRAAIHGACFILLLQKWKCSDSTGKSRKSEPTIRRDSPSPWISTRLLCFRCTWSYGTRVCASTASNWVSHCLSVSLRDGRPWIFLSLCRRDIWILKTWEWCFQTQKDASDFNWPDQKTSWNQRAENCLKLQIQPSPPRCHSFVCKRKQFCLCDSFKFSSLLLFFFSRFVGRMRSTISFRYLTVVQIDQRNSRNAAFLEKLDDGIRRRWIDDGKQVSAVVINKVVFLKPVSASVKSHIPVNFRGRCQVWAMQQERKFCH